LKKCLPAVLFMSLIFLFAGCKSYGTKLLDKGQIANSRTALIIDTEFFASQTDTNNSFNLKCEDMTKDECNEVTNRLKQLEGQQRSQLLAYLAGVTYTALTEKGMPPIGLVDKTYFDSRQFPMTWPGDKRIYCAVSRDYTALAQKGYTHVLYAGFPNRILYKKDAPPSLLFGIEAFMVDIRPTSGDMTKKENRVQRQAWCYTITPSLQSRETRSSYTQTELRARGYATVDYITITTTYFRDCLGIVLVRRDGSTYSLDELFTGTAPVYLELYKRAALYTLSFASQQLAGKWIPSEKVKKGAGAEAFISEDFIPAQKIKDLSKLTFASNSGKVNSVAFSPDGRTIASGSYNGFVQLSDVASGNQMRFFYASNSKYGWIGSVAFSPDGKIIASGGSDKFFKLWDAASGKLMATFTGHSNAVSSLAFSPDGKTIASGSWDKSVKLWDVASGKLTATFTGHSEEVVAVAFSPDGRTIASGSRDKSAKLWDVASGKLTATFTGHSEDVVTVAFSPDGKTIASGSLDKSVKLWDVASGKPTATFTGHSDRVRSVTFSKDGKTIASGSNDRSVKLWDAASGKLISTFTGHSEAVVSVALSPDGKTIASGSNDESIKLWDAAEVFRVKH
jgi:WD40 repeat protein